MASTARKLRSDATTNMGAGRIAAIDIARALSLAGIVAINWVSYLTRHAVPDTGALAGWFRHGDNPIATWAPAVAFVLVAGIGISLLTADSRTSGDAAAIEGDRWRLRRRALVFFAAAYPLHWFWSGEILHFFAAYFVVASIVLTWRTRTLVALSVVVTFGAVAIEALVRHYPSLAWLAQPDIHRPKQLAGDLLAAGTHPIFPWLAFVLIGMAIGRGSLTQPGIGERMLALGAVAWVAAHAGEAIADSVVPARHAWIFAIDPGTPMPLYVLSAGGFAVALLGACLFVTTRVRPGRVSRSLAVTGRQTFSLYYLHAVVAVVAGRYADARDLTVLAAVVASLVFWFGAVVMSNVYNALWGLGPAERLLRRVGD